MKFEAWESILGEAFSQSWSSQAVSRSELFLSPHLNSNTGKDHAFSLEVLVGLAGCVQVVRTVQEVGVRAEPRRDFAELVQQLIADAVVVIRNDVGVTVLADHVVRLGVSDDDGVLVAVVRVLDVMLLLVVVFVLIHVLVAHIVVEIAVLVLGVEDARCVPLVVLFVVVAVVTKLVLLK